MPGVPSGRACDGCRKQKKKCDEKTPACSRCIRLGLECIGSGQRRYKFQEQRYSPPTLQRGKRDSPNESQISAVCNLTQNQVESNIATLVIHLPPSNKLTTLTSRYIHLIKLSVDLRYNPAWAFGFFMFEVPRRMNTGNEALDSAIYALVCSHSDVCARQRVSIQSLSSYSHALRGLRTCLNDPAKASTSETLCAVMLLLICQSMNGPEGQRWSGHCEGAAQILKARSSMKPRNDFEQQLLLSLRGCVLFEGLLNERINLTSEEWMSLIANEIDEKLPEGQLMRYMARIPDIIRRRRMNVIDNDRDVTAALREEMRPIYLSCKTILDHLRTKWVEHQRAASPTTHELSAVILHAYRQRSYGLGLLVATIITCIIRTFVASEEKEDLEKYSAYLVKETIEMAHHANMYRPLGSSYMAVALSTAWLAATDENDRLSAEVLLHDYASDFPMRTKGGIARELKYMAREMESLGFKY